WIMLRKAVNIAYQCEGLFNFDSIDDYLSMDDSYVELELRRLSKRREDLTKEMRVSCDLHDMLERRNLFKSVYEIIVHKTESSCIINEKLKEEIEEAIAKEAKVDQWMVVVDTPMIPSLPYTPTQPDPMDIPVCEDREGVLVKRRLTEFSKLVESLRGYVNIIRVYSHPSMRREVAKASEKVIQSLLPRSSS
ncbi:MAG: hypothetical protein QXP47_04765, partial [Candidatus Nezhaarchaeales archaeon]